MKVVATTGTTCGEVAMIVKGKVKREAGPEKARIEKAQDQVWIPPASHAVGIPLRSVNVCAYDDLDFYF